MSGYQVDPTELFAARARVAEAADDGRAELARLQTDADDLLGPGWRGAAASAFRGGYEEWLDAARTMLHALDELAESLGLAGRDYERAEDVNNDGFRRMVSA